MSYIGTTKIGGVYLGSTGIAKAYLGASLVFQKGGQPQPVEPTPDHACLTFRSSGNNTLSLSITGTAAPVLYYSMDGTTWTQWDYSALNFSSGHPLFLYGNNQSGFSTGTSDYAQFSIGGTGAVECDGSIAVLINGTIYMETVPCSYCFYNLFRSCAKLITAPSLPSTALKTHCYRSMFYGCSDLAAAPVLPATTLQQSCYREMFRGCSSLSSAPTLPATTLKNYCYYNMFRDCTAMTAAPDLLATTLVSNCYGYMFYGASNLEYIKALFTTAPGSSYTSNWVSGVKSTGIFIKSSSASWTTTGTSAVPTGWTIQTASS